MLYIILIGVIIFLVIKLSKSKSAVSIDKIVEQATREIEEKLRLKTVATEQPKPLPVEPIIVETPVPVVRQEKPNQSENMLAVDETIESEIADDPELTPEDEKKPLAEIIKKRIHHRKVLTLNEQPMFHRLKEALPEYSVLPQVSFNSLVWSRSKYIRNRFNRKVCDFAICDEVFKPIVVVELDDSSHNGREQEDADRDCILNEAKIRVIRYKQTPEIEVIRRDFGLEPLIK